MSFFKRLFFKEVSNPRSVFVPSGVDSSSCSDPMKLSTVYRCVRLISDDIARLPINVYKLDKDGFKKPYVEHPAYWLLKEEPSEIMTRFTLLQTIVSSCLLNGNAYIEIVRKPMSAQPASLIFHPYDRVKIEVIEGEKDTIKYLVFGDDKNYRTIPSDDMIHIMNYTINGYIGISTLEHAAHTLGLASSSEKYANRFFTGGSATNVLKLQASLSEKQREDVRKQWINATSVGGSGVVVLQHNMDYQSISINAKDAQMLETRAFNVVDICRFFGVSPIKAFDLSKNSYSTIEATQLDHLATTIKPWLEKIELEFKRKIFTEEEKKSVRVEFDTKELVSIDSTTLSNYYSQMLNAGAMTPNEIRREIGMPRIEGGDDAFIQVNLQDVQQPKKKLNSDE